MVNYNYIRYALSTCSTRNECNNNDDSKCYQHTKKCIQSGTSSIRWKEQSKDMVIPHNILIKTQNNTYHFLSCVYLCRAVAFTLQALSRSEFMIHMHRSLSRQSSNPSRSKFTTFILGDDGCIIRAN